MIYSKDEVRFIKEDVWAFSFEASRSKNLKLLYNNPPTLGKIVSPNKWYTYFIPYGKSGKLCESKRKNIDTSGLIFSDNKEEAIEMYNSKVKERIKELEDKISYLKEKLI